MLDQERCILCSRCVRFTDEISKTGEFGIFNRGDRAELGLYPGPAAGQSLFGQRHRHLPGGRAHREGFSLQGQGLVPLERADGVQRLRAGMQRRRPLRARQAPSQRRRARPAPEAPLQRGRQPVVDVRRGALRFWLDRPRTPDEGPPSGRRVHVGAGHRRHCRRAREASSERQPAPDSVSSPPRSSRTRSSS